MKRFKNISIQQTIILIITCILAIAVSVSIILVYYINTETTKGLVYEQASEINKQIVMNYENYTNRLENMANLLQKECIAYDTKTEVEELRNLLIKLEEIENSVSAISLFDNAGKVIISTQQIHTIEKEIALKEWYKDALFDDNIIHFSSPHQQNIFLTPMEEVISVSKVVEFTYDGQRKDGILLIDMNFKGLDSLSSITNLGETGHILILDEENDIVYSSDEEAYHKGSESYRIVKDTIFGRTNAVIQGSSMAININTISSTRWRIATFQNISSIDAGMERSLYTVIIVLLITMGITIMIASFVADMITNPLKKMDNAILKFQNGDYDAKVKVHGHKEIRIVMTGYNVMVDQIKNLMDEVVREQEGKRQTEIAALQNQINPHFLYNTLDCIIWLAEKERNEDLVTTVNALSTYFRVSLSKGKQFIPIAEELRHIQSYLFIQSMRYTGAYTYKVTCNPHVENIRIMKLLLQPLVENAIYHGIDKDDDESYIHIEVDENESFIILSVKNSGYGISETKIKEIYKVMEEGNEKGSVGMKNVYRRIQLFYGEKAKLHIESELDESTTIRIMIPKERIEQ